MKKKAIQLAQKYNLIIVIVLCYAFFCMISPSFFTVSNILKTIEQSVPLCIMSIGATFLIICGHFDLSLGSSLSMCGVFCIMLCNIISPLAAILLTLLLGMLSGALNGFLVGYLRFNSIIVTMGTLSIYKGIALLISRGRDIYLLNESSLFTDISSSSIGIFPSSLVILTGFTILFMIIINNTRFGHHVEAIGNNAVAGYFSGIHKSFVIMSCYTLSGAATAIAAIVLSARGGGAQPNMGDDFEFDVIISVVLSGIACNEGIGAVFFSLIGALTIGILKTGFSMNGMPSYAIWIAYAVIILSTLFFQNKRKHPGKRRAERSHLD